MIQFSSVAKRYPNGHEALRDVSEVDLRISDESVPGQVDVDAKLLELTERWGATLVTTDHNLAKVAGLRGVSVLNPHVVGDALRPGMSAGRVVKINFGILLDFLAITLQQQDELFFIVQVVQCQGWDLPDQIMSVNQIWHKGILAKFLVLSMEGSRRQE